MARITQIRPHTVLLIIIIAVLGAVVMVNLIFGRIDQISDGGDELNNIHGLISVEDGAEVVSTQFFILNIQSKRAAFIDIPPYLGVIVDRNDSLDRIDTLVAENNFAEYLDEVAGFTDKSIDFYLRFNVEDFVSLIDLLEGVRMFIISAPGDTQALPSGDVVLDGEKTAEYIALYRAETDAKLQIEGLQELIYRTVLTLSEQPEYLGNKDVLAYLARIVDTNLRRNELKTLLTEIIYGITEERVQTWVTQGDVRSVVVGERRESLLFPDLDGRWLAQTVSQVENQIVHQRALGAGSEGVRMEIINGTATGGLARRTKLLYEQFGYTVTRIDNYQNQNVVATRLINHGVAEEIAAEIAGVINMDSERIEIATEERVGEHDLTLIIGNDFDGVTVRAEVTQ